MAETERREVSSFAKAYLFIYNVAQAFGWSYISIICCMHFSQNGLTPKGLSSIVEVPLKIFQTGAILEVVHCIIGIVGSSPLITAVQVASRVFIVWLVTYSVKEVQGSLGILLYILPWTVTEIVRYSLYACNLIKYRPSLLHWCRYTFFILLYPVGVTGELLTIYTALPHVKKSNLYSVSMPNALNMSFSYYIFLWCAFAAYIPGFPMLYMHMIHQRKKVLGRASQSSVKQD